MPSREEARRRHAAHYAGLLAGMRDEYIELADRDNVVERFEREWEQLRAGQAWAAGATQPESGDADLAYVFASHADPLVGLRHGPGIVREWIAPALSHDEAIRDPAIVAENLNRIGRTHYNAGEFQEAREVWRQALEMHRRIDASADPHYFEMQEAGYEANLGSAEERLGYVGAARTAYECARDVFHRLGERQQEGRAWLNLGTLHAAEDAHEEAIEAYGHAAELAMDTDDTDGRELAFGAMGNSLADLERLTEARTMLELALKLARGLRDKAREALRLGNLGNVLLRQGDYEGALRQRSDALALAKEMGDPRTEALQLHGIGQIHSERGQFDQAQSYFEEAERIFLTIGMSEVAAQSRRGGTDAAKRQSLKAAIAIYNERINDGRYGEAIEALDRWTALGHEPTPYQQSVLLGLYGFGEHLSGRLERAAELFAQALELDRELPQGELAANHLGNVGDFYRDLGDARHAHVVYRAALQIADVPDVVREKLAYGLKLAQELSAEQENGGLESGVAQDVGVELFNRSVGGGAVDVSVTYQDGSTITGRSAYVELGPGLPEITLELAGGLPLNLAFGRIASIRVLS